MEGLLFIFVVFVIPIWLILAASRMQKEKNEAIRQKEKIRRLDETSQWVNRYNNPKFKGDVYERYIGKSFEDKGFYVIYHGIRKNKSDKGIDLIAYSKQKKILALVQCKNWSRKALSIHDIQLVSRKMDDFISSSMTKTILLDGIRQNFLGDDQDRNFLFRLMKIAKEKNAISDLMKVTRRYQTLKLLYISRFNFDPETLSALKRLSDNHFAFENDIEIIIKPIN